MNEKNSQAPLNCGCRCGCPLNDDPKQVREKVVDRVKVIMNISCFESAYGKEPTNSADVVGRILALLSLNDPEFEAQLRGSDQAELEEQLMSLERLSSWGKKLNDNRSNDEEIASIEKSRDEILSRMKNILDEISRS